MSTNKTILRALSALLIPAAIAACGDDSTAPGDMGQVSASLQDGTAASLAQAYSMSPSSGPETGPSQAVAAAFSGSASGSAQVWIYSDAEGWVALGSPADATVQMQSSNTTTLYTSASVPAGSYTKVRLVLDGFGANIAAGSIIGGLTLSAGVTITVGGSDGHVEIEKTVTPFTVSAQSSASIDFDLNSEAWVTEESAQSETASDAEVTSATKATVS